MANTVFIELPLPLRAFNEGKAMPLHLSLAVTRVLVLFFALEIC
jgi:hypothetical protein